MTYTIERYYDPAIEDYREEPKTITVCKGDVIISEKSDGTYYEETVTEVTERYYKTELPNGAIVTIWAKPGSGFWIGSIYWSIRRIIHKN